MTSTLSSFPVAPAALARHLRPGLVLLGALLAPLAAAAETPPALASLTYSGDQAALIALDADIAAAGTDPAKLTAIESTLLAVLRGKDTTFAARQAVCQRLGLVLAQSAPKSSTAAYKPLDAMLLDERECDLARLALEFAPGAAVDALFVTALGKTSGATRIALLSSIGPRRIESAIPALTKLLAEKHTVTALAAARALGAIGSAAAESALRNADTLPADTRAHSRLQSAARLPAADARRIAGEVQADASLPVAVRAAAFRLSLDLDPKSATARIVEVLGGSDWTYKQVALESLAGALPAERVTALAAGLARWDEPTQAAVLAALARSGQVAAVPAAVAAASHPSAEVRSAAIAALGFLPGNREIVALLTKIAAGESAEAKTAKQSLTRLNGPDVSAAILAGAERGETPLRVASFDLLALRHQTEALPFLLKCRTDTDAAVRAAAVGALGELAPYSEQRALLDWAIAATDDTEQARALRALVNVTLRQRDESERGAALFTAIESAPPEVAIRLLPALGRLGGTASAACAARLAVRPEATVAAAAASALGRWPDATALSATTTVVETAAVATVRDSARTAALQSLERNRDAWTPERTQLLARLLAASKESAHRKPLLAVLARANDQPALQLAESLQADASVAEEARYAAAAISAAIAGAPKLRGSQSSGLSNVLDGKTSSRWSTPLLGEEWIEIDFRQSRPLRRLTLDQTGRATEFPERYEVHVTDDPKSPGPVVAQGPGQRNKTVIDLPAGTQGRYVIIKNTVERKDTPWAICELYLD